MCSENPTSTAAPEAAAKAAKAGVRGGGVTRPPHSGRAALLMVGLTVGLMVELLTGARGGVGNAFSR